MVAIPKRLMVNFCKTHESFLQLEVYSSLKLDWYTEAKSEKGGKGLCPNYGPNSKCLTQIFTSYQN